MFACAFPVAALSLIITDFECELCFSVNLLLVFSVAVEIHCAAPLLLLTRPELDCFAFRIFDEQPANSVFNGPFNSTFGFFAVGSPSLLSLSFPSKENFSVLSEYSTRTNLLLSATVLDLVIIGDRNKIERFVCDGDALGDDELDDDDEDDEQDAADDEEEDEVDDELNKTASADDEDVVEDQEDTLVPPLCPLLNLSAIKHTQCIH